MAREGSWGGGEYAVASNDIGAFASSPCAGNAGATPCGGGRVEGGEGRGAGEIESAFVAGPADLFHAALGRLGLS